MSEGSETQLDRIEGALKELGRHLLNTQTDVDDLKQAHTLIQGGFQGNVDAQREIMGKVDGYTARVAVLGERVRLLAWATLPATVVTVVLGVLCILSMAAKLLESGSTVIAAVLP